MLRSYFNKAYIEAGIDEAGRGCLAGPVVAAAVILPKAYKNKWLNDSKQLSHQERKELREVVQSKAICFAVGEASHDEIDKINILNASFLAMHRAVDKMCETHIPEHLLIDGNRFSPYLSIPHTCIIKGDAKFLSIAAASILAKTYRDDIMELLDLEYPQYNWVSNKGYPTSFHRKAIKIHGFTPLHRLTFSVK